MRAKNNNNKTVCSPQSRHSFTESTRQNWLRIHLSHQRNDAISASVALDQLQTVNYTQTTKVNSRKDEICISGVLTQNLDGWKEVYLLFIPVFIPALTIVRHKITLKRQLVLYFIAFFGKYQSFSSVMMQIYYISRVSCSNSSLRQAALLCRLFRRSELTWKWRWPQYNNL